MYLSLSFDKNFLKIAAPTPSTRAKTIENSPYKIGTFFERSLTNWDTGPKFSGLAFNSPLANSSTKKVS